MLDPITSQGSLSDTVFESLRDAIINRTLAPGDRITEAGLATQLNVSKTPVREALLRLQHVGLVEPDGRRGGRIVIASPEAIRSSYEVRAALEVHAARLASERADTESRTGIRRLADETLSCAESHDLPGFRSGDRKFHFEVASLSANPRLEVLIHEAYDRTWILRRRDVPNAVDSVACATQHTMIAAAIERGDPDDAALQMRLHIEKVQDLVVGGFLAHHTVSMD